MSSTGKELEGAKIALTNKGKLDEYASLVADEMQRLFDYQEERLVAYLEGRQPRVRVCACCGAGAVLCTCPGFLRCGCGFSHDSQVGRYECFGKVLATMEAVRDALSKIEKRTPESLLEFMNQTYGSTRGSGGLRCIYDLYAQKICKVCK